MIIKNRKLQNTDYQLPTKCGFTLIEVLIASFIFTVVGLIGVTVFVNVMRTQQRVRLENALYEDARFMMERVAREIRENAVDYEEYYNKIEPARNYGAEYGCYATRFYDPGTGGTPNNGNFGVQCSNNVQPSDLSCIVIDSTIDTNTGQNPYSTINSLNNESTAANAFCDKNFEQNDSHCGDQDQLEHHIHDELYLIDPKGDQKTLLALKKIRVDNEDVSTLGLLRLSGEDFDHDGIVEKWSSCTNNSFCCALDFDCDPAKFMAAGVVRLEDTLNTNNPNSAKNYLGFVPISPSRTNIQSLQFFVAPVEDPRKAFAETSSEIQQQPHVTVVLTATPSQAALKNYPEYSGGGAPTVTLQTTISSRVYNEVRSFYGKNVCSNP